MRRVSLVLLAAALAAAAPPSPAAAAGRWSTYIRPYSFIDIEAGPDSVWYATDNAGLLLLDRRTGTLTPFTREPGQLSGNEISSLALDRSRRLWVATRGGGVSRLSPDGRWRLVNAFDGLPGDEVTTVKAYGDTVWIGTTAGLAFWNGREISGVLPDGVNPSPFASDRVASIVMSGDSVWVATAAGAYLGRMSENLQNWTPHSENLSSTDFTSLVSDGTSLIAHVGASTFARTATQWVFTGGIGAVWRLAEDHGIILASSENGLFRWNGTGWTLIDAARASSPSQLPRRVVAAAYDPGGTLFAARTEALYERAAGATDWTARDVPGPVGNDMANLIADAEGVYVTTRGEGISRLRGSVWTNWPSASPCPTCTARPNSAGADVFGAMVDTQGLKWFASWGDALEILDDSGATPVFTHLWVGAGREFDMHTWGWGMAADPNGGRWLGSDSPCLGCSEATAPSGIDYYDAVGNYVRTYDVDNTPVLLGNQVRAITFDQANTMWVGYGFEGANGFLLPVTPGGELAQTRVLQLVPPGAQDVFGIVTYGDSIWVLSADSLRLFTNFGSAPPVRYATLASVTQPGAVHPLEVTADGSVWTAADGGLRVRHPDGTHEDFTTANSPLAGNTVRSIRAEVGSGAVWIVTTSGLNRYDPWWVAPPPTELPSLRVTVFPNPIDLTGLGFALRLTGEGTSYRGAVYGLDGRRVRGVSVAANGAVAWDGRDDDGALVRPGVYFLRVEAGGRSATARVVVLR